MRWVFDLSFYRGCLWSSKESFESKIIPSSSFLFSDMMMWLSILALTLSFPADSMGTVIKRKKTGLLAELEKYTTYVKSFPKSSCSIALAIKVKCVGLTFYKAGDEIFNAAL